MTNIIVGEIVTDDIIRGTVTKGNISIDYQTTKKTVETAKEHGIDVIAEIKAAIAKEFEHA